jgi:hypothetical protein
MTLPRAVVIAGAVFPTAYDSALLMLDDCLASLVLEIAASASSWTSMTARQDRGARRCAFKAVLGDVDGAFDLDDVLSAWNFFRHNDIAMNAPKVQCPMAGDVVLDATARKRNVVGGNHALAAILAAGWFLTWVIARHVTPLARLLASENRMHRFGMTSRLTLVTALCETLGTCLHASTLGAEAHEVIRLTDLENLVRMTRAAKLDCIANRVLSA